MKVRLIRNLALLVLIGGAVQPLAAGTAYVPVATNIDVSGVTFETVMWLTNTGSAPAGFSTRFIPSDTDGTPPAEAAAAAKINIPPGGTFFPRGLAPQGSTGMLEITTDANIVAIARLEGNLPGDADGVGATVPVVASESLLAAGDTVELVGLQRSPLRTRSNVGVLNLGSKLAECAVSAYQATGSQILQTVLLGVPPFGHRQFDDALQIIGLSSASHVRLRMECDQPFFAYSTLYDVTLGEATFIGPSAVPDLQVGSPPAPPLECATGATCFARDGVFYVPSPKEPIGHVDFPLPPGQYKQVHLSLDVTHGGWAPKNPDGNHNIFWMVRDINRDMFGFLNIKGPNNDEILLRHGFGQRHTQKAKLTKTAIFRPGATYRFDYLYDTEQRIVRVIVTEGGTEVVRMTGTPDIGVIDIGAENNVFIEFGFKEGINPEELPTYGWGYANLRASFLRR